MNDELPLVLVTGASGFVASHVVAGLVAEQKYRVRGTVRSSTSETSKLLKETFPDVELVEADLSKDDGWKEAVAGCAYVHHVASPIITLDEEPDREKMIRLPVEGIERVFGACVDAGTVKRVVLTGTSSAISYDWTDPESPKLPPYEIGKTLAEKAAWEFVKNLEDGKKFELVVTSPVVIYGPLILNRASSSHEAVGVLLRRDFPAVPNVAAAFVDVRDVKKAHLIAMIKPEAAGKRYILCSDTVAMTEIAQVLAKEFNPQGYNVSVHRLPTFVLWFSKFFSQKAKVAYDYCGTFIRYDNSPMKNELGIEPIGIKESIIESAYSLIDKGIIPKKPGYRKQGAEE
ncbi:uncharacterized protein [Oscarella lobularis]|uniref:uncharacterized protein isoform X2 n=1 Tax=Oscarella lobularis TaxID=121494 RepID=UPI003313B496